MRKKRHFKVWFYTDAGGEHRWRLKASNGRIIADSGEGYSTRANAVRAWRNLQSDLYMTAWTNEYHAPDPADEDE